MKLDIEKAQETLSVEPEPQPFEVTEQRLLLIEQGPDQPTRRIASNLFPPLQLRSGAHPSGGEIAARAA